jgi:hypothetical protein
MGAIEMNRVSKSVTKMKAQIDKRIADGLTTAERVEDSRVPLDMDLDEYIRFHELKSLAVTQGKLTADEGQYIYRMLGETPASFNRQSIEVKAVFTSLFKELLGAQIG